MLNVKFTTESEINPVQLEQHLRGYSGFLAGSKELYEANLYIESVKRFIIMRTRHSLVHNIFLDALVSGANELFLSGSIALITAIEASLKHELSKLGYRSDIADPVERINYMPNLNTRLLKEAKTRGLPIEVMALGTESFNSTIPEKPKIVVLRNNICHGNFSAFLEETDDGQQFFTRECLRDSYFELLSASILWMQALAQREGV